MEPALVTQLIKAHFSAPPAGYVCGVHLHPYFQFDAILGNEVEVLLEARKTLRLRAGEGLLIPPLVRHGYRIRRGYQQASFKFHLAPRVWPLFGRTASKVRLSSALIECLRSTGACCSERDPFAGQQFVALLTLCLGETIRDGTLTERGAAGNEPMLRKLWPLLERIESSRATGWTVVAMARECHLSADHFSRQFRRILKQSPQSYLFEARMRAAAVSLSAEPPAPIKEIAERTGYATVHSFSRAFKQMFGTGPAAYREGPSL